MIKLNKIDPNPETILHPSDEKVGVIIDCKDNESGSDHFELELYLADLTIQNFYKKGLTNFIVFEDRDDIDIAVNTFENKGIEKVLMVHSGMVCESKTKRFLPNMDHITAHMIDNTVLRQYAIFDVEKYTYFQLRGNFLANVVNDVQPVPPMDLGLHYLYPKEETICFWDPIVNNKKPLLNLLEPHDHFAGQQTLDFINELID